MKARVWFQAQGQRMRSRGFNWHEAKVLIGLYSLPRWAQQAVARGHLNQTYGVQASFRCYEANCGRPRCAHQCPVCETHRYRKD
jgi:hypothetical protein